MRPATPAREEAGCAYGALTLCDGQVTIAGPSRGRLCPCEEERLLEAAQTVAGSDEWPSPGEELVTLIDDRLSRS